jgi:mannose/fructose-specific phosphotransferase system component IIA
MLVEAYMARQMAPDVKTLAVSTAASGKDQVGYFEKELVGSADDEDEIELD